MHRLHGSRDNTLKTATAAAGVEAVAAALAAGVAPAVLYEAACGVLHDRRRPEGGGPATAEAVRRRIRIVDVDVQE